MITLIAFYSVLVGAILAAAAACADSACALRRWSRRPVWTAALIAVLALPAVAAWGTTPAGSASTTVVTGTTSVRMLAATWLPDAAGLGGSDVAAMLTRSADPIALVIWLVASVATLAVYTIGHRALARRRRTWRETDMAGTRVLVSGDSGPAVVGLFAPRIVVPAWVMNLDARAQALIVEHERQHVAARDVWLVHLTCLATVLCPWNPALWWLKTRLRLAIELDCDARVLRSRRGEIDDAEVYGHVLIDVASHRVPGAAAIAPALIEAPSRLARRIAAIFPRDVRHAGVKTAASLLAAAALVTAACGAPVPAPPVEPSSTGSVSQPAAAGGDSASAGGAAHEATLAASQPVVFDVDTPGLANPVVLHDTKPVYTPAAMQAKVAGTVVLEAVVGVDGRATDVRVTQPLHRELDESAVTALRQWLFKPATREGQAVASRVTVEMEFSIR